MPTTTYRRQASAAGGLWSSNHAGPYRPGKNSEWVQWNDQNDEGREWGLERGCRELPQPGPGRSPGHTPYQHFLNVTERFRWKENATFLLNMVTILTTAITPSPPLNAALRSRAPVSVLSTRRHAKYFRRPPCNVTQAHYAPRLVRLSCHLYIRYRPNNKSEYEVWNRCVAK